MHNLCLFVLRRNKDIPSTPVFPLTQSRNQITFTLHSIHLHLCLAVTAYKNCVHKFKQIITFYFINFMFL